MDQPATIRRMFDIQRNTLDEDGNRIIDIELTAYTTHYEEICGALYFKPVELLYKVTCGDHVKEGVVPVTAPRFRLVFERGRDPSGVWEVSIHARDAYGYSDEVWRQSLFVQTRFKRDPAHIERLALRYAPIFVFSEQEEYYPVSLRTLLNAEPIRQSADVMKLRTLFGAESIPLPQLGDFLRFNGHRDYLLDFNWFNFNSSSFVEVMGDVQDITVYYSYMEDPEQDRFFITYHMFYAFDTKVGLARMVNIGPHVFDRESMIMVFEGERERPTSMIISGHLEDQTIFLPGKLMIWTQGRILVDYDDPRTLKLGDHPIVAVAEGSHALFPTSGVYHIFLLRELAGFVDRRVLPWEADSGAMGKELYPHQIICPDWMVSHTIPRYRLRSLGLERMTSHIDPDTDEYEGYNAYLTFSGYWVDVPGPTNARFPPFTRKMSEIVGWADGAFTWNWDDVPDLIHKNNHLILSFLFEHIEGF